MASRRAGLIGQVCRAQDSGLQAEGMVHHEQVAQLERALVTARVIGAAIGILMESRKVSQDQAFAMLREASSRANRSVREIAAAIVEGQAPSPETHACAAVRRSYSVEDEQGILAWWKRPRSSRLG
jgi:hypothetical protein